MIVSVVVGGSSPNVGVYIVAALFLGVFFALQSGMSSRSPTTRSWRRRGAPCSSARLDGSASSRARASL